MNRSRRCAASAGLAVLTLSLAAALACNAPALAEVDRPPVAARPLLPTTAEGWSAAARRDVEAAYKLFFDNHPGMFNIDDPDFPARLKAARLRGFELATRVRDGAGFSATLDAFSAVLRDGHALVVAELPQTSTIQRWPGFVAAWRGDHMRVFASVDPHLPPGAIILGCDGLDIKALVRTNVFAFGGNSDEPGQWWAQARNLFRDDGNPFVVRPRRCRFSADGALFESSLTWRPIDLRFRAWRKESYNGEVLTAGLTQPRPKLFWLALPTFLPNDAERSAYRAAFADLRQRRSEILAADAVVIDLRGNQGGSSFWGNEAVKALWGPGPVDKALGADPSRVLWRASPGNTLYVSRLREKLRAQGQVDDAAYASRAAVGMEAALAKGQPYWLEPADAAVSASAASHDLPMFDTPVYVIVPGQCASACLDALDLLTHFPNTKLVGAPSSADTTYMDVRMETLPDGLAMAVIPNKLYRNRPRASGQGYAPAIEIDDLDWSTATFRAAVEADLRRGDRSR